MTAVDDARETAARALADRHSTAQGGPPHTDAAWEAVRSEWVTRVNSDLIRYHDVIEAMVTRRVVEELAALLPDLAEVDAADPVVDRMEKLDLDLALEALTRLRRERSGA